MHLSIWSAPTAIENEKVKLLFEDGKEFIKKQKDFFDVIILDLSDPEGPALDLITQEFYQDVKDALKKDGIVSIQSGSLTHQPEVTSTIYKRVSKIFPYVKIHKAVIPTYQAGEFSFTVASKSNLDKVTLEKIQQRYEKLKLNLKYYNPQIHFASTVLPNYLKDLLPGLP